MVVTDFDTKFRCPVCRARQPIQNECRRCRADLSLVAAAYGRVSYLLAEREVCQNAEDGREQMIDEELQIIAPRLFQ